MSEIRIMQCLCPERHAILAICYDTAEMAPQEAKAGFEELVETMIARGEVRRRCEICGKDVTFHYEDGKSKFKSIEEAMPELKRLEAEQMLTRSIVRSEKN